MRSLATVGLLVLIAAQAKACAPPPEPEIFTISGYASEWDEASGNWFRVAELDQRLLVPDGAERETHWRLLTASDEHGIALRIRFDAGAGRLSADGRSIEYPLCSIGIPNGPSFGNEARNCPRRASGRRSAEKLLALGVAQSVSQPAAARRTLGEALAATRTLSPRARAIAFGARGNATEALASDASDADSSDRLLAEALADFRRQASLAPRNADARFAIARVLIALGGYEEALDLFRAIGKRWPGRAYDVAVRTGALYRQQGDYRQALLELDNYARGGEDRGTGMRFHYHRAWMLVLLGRYEEAEREIDQGLATQPDYPSAFHLRSCARARLGRLAQALADQRRALELLGTSTAGANAGPRAELDHSRTAIAALEQAIASGRRGPVIVPCEEYWDPWIRPRLRSPLLDGGEPPPA